MQIEEIEIESLIPYQRNNKIHDETQINRIANSLKEFGFLQPLVIDKNNVLVVWHWRLEWAKKLWLRTAPCVRAENLTEAQIKKYRILDNKLNESEYNIENLKTEFDSLDDFKFWDIELSISDFPELEAKIDSLDDDLNEELWTTNEVDVPDVKKQAIVQRWDVFLIWKHKLMCWSSTDCVDVWELMKEDNAKLLFTSPPYSDMREYNWSKDLSVEHICKFIETYSPYTEYQCVNLWIQRKDWEVFEYRNEYIAEARSVWYKLLSRNVRDKMNVWSIWQQTAMFPIRHERIFVFWKEFLELNRSVEKNAKNEIWKQRKATNRNADWTIYEYTKHYSDSEYKKMESVLYCVSERWEIRKDHPAVFPIKLPWEYIKAMTKENDIVIEPFWWSWSTLIACEQLNRCCRIMELDERYCEVILRRIHRINKDIKIECVNRNIDMWKILSDDK